MMHIFDYMDVIYILYIYIYVIYLFVFQYIYIYIHMFVYDPYFSIQRISSSIPPVLSHRTALFLDTCSSRYKNIANTFGASCICTPKNIT